VLWQLELNIGAEGQHPPGKFCVQIRSKYSQVETQQVLGIFILFKVTR